jgi:Gene product 88
VYHYLINPKGQKMLIRSKDRKVANQVNAGGKQATMANTFGLPSGVAFSCPGATSVCEKICYAGNLERVFKGVRNVLLSNWEQLNACGFAGKVSLLGEMIVEFVEECDKRNAEKLFRIHWDGDFFNEEYTKAWAVVILSNPDVQFWAYTRSDFAVPLLIDLPNLSLYFSADEANKDLAIALKKTYGVKLAYLAKDFATGKSDFEQLQEKSAIPCPENNKKISMISTKGSACVLCSQCVFNRNDILFSASKK